MIIASTIKGVYIADEEKCTGYSLCIMGLLNESNKTDESWEYIKLGIIKEYQLNKLIFNFKMNTLSFLSCMILSFSSIHHSCGDGARRGLMAMVEPS